MAEKQGAVAEFARRKWGGELAEIVETSQIGTSVAELLGGDPERVSAVIINLSANTLYVSPRVDVSATSGIRLAANGGSITMDADNDGVLPSRQWYALADGADSDVYLLTLRRISLEPRDT